ncbi:flagellar export chaperone FliS [Carnobacterium sp. 17-4]|uniref:flagellar export chaperone FliS n=1 Tax=Carnobacterium sp. (strain 17-4) TaxID=208596 RepID=UPI0002E5E9E5|nr:flagellar export chaperone FliS [Carnobacterium sp. 17-4]
MYQKNGSAIYKENQILNASPKKLIVLLYEGCIKNLKLAEIHITEKNIEKTNQVLIKAQDILAELMNTLDFEKGGEVAENLYRMYEYLTSELVKANISKNIEDVQRSRKLIEELRDTWIEIE